jgi:hypothetical protein
MGNDAQTFYDALTSALPDHLRPILWRKQGRKTLGAATTGSIAKVAGKRDIYMSTCPIEVDKANEYAGTDQRNKADDASALIALWLDLDVKDGYFETKDEASEFADDLTPPTILVDSGHGIQAWWVLDTPWVFNGNGDRDDAHSLSEKWHALAIQESGVKIDPVQDLARVLRVPGTVNAKERQTCDVLLLSADGPRYSLSDLEERVADVSVGGADAASEAGDPDWTIPVGEQNTRLTSLAGLFRHDAAMNEQEIYETLTILEARLEGDFSDRDDQARKIARSVAKYDVGKVPWAVRFPNAHDIEQIDTPKEFPRDALYGVLGDIVKVREDYTEAPRSFLYSCLIAFASAYVGKTPSFTIGATRHGAALYVLNVGESAKARKGTAEDEARFVFDVVDPEFMAKGGALVHGVSSAEGLGDRLDNRINSENDDDGKPTLKFDPRFLNVESEFSRVLKVAARAGNPIEEALTTLWDSGSMHSQTRNRPITVQGVHFAMLASITKSAFDDFYLAQAASRGLGNRIMYVHGTRAHVIAHPEVVRREDIEPFAMRIRAARTFALKHSDPFQLTVAAHDRWEVIYAELDLVEDRGAVGAVLHRSGAIVRRLALLFAVLDLSDTIDVPHLDAAYAFWRFSADTARYLFGNSLGDADLDKAYRALSDAPAGLTTTDLNAVFSRNKNGAQLEHILGRLHDLGLVHKLKNEPHTKGRPVKRWIATKYT